MRIRGQVGPYLVDLEIGLTPEEWQRLRLTGVGEDDAVTASPVMPAGPACTAMNASLERSWQDALEWLQQIGEASGPELLAALEQLTGDLRQAKRLAVRLRHHAQVDVRPGADAPLYRWVG